MNCKYTTEFAWKIECSTNMTEEIYNYQVAFSVNLELYCIRLHE